jgi:S-adenosylmethionine hydrolase
VSGNVFSVGTFHDRDVNAAVNIKVAEGRFGDFKTDVEESVRLLLKKQHPVKRQPHSATILKKWRGEESPSVCGQ